MSTFRKATKTSTRIRISLIGPSGSGKTYSALSIAAGMGGKVAVIDTEHGSASKYCDIFEFDTLELGTFDPRQYIEAIQAAENEGYRVVVIDSLSHAWTGKGGALELVDKFTTRSRTKNAFTEGWREVTPLHNALIDAIVGSSCHVIATMRSKVDYVMEVDSRSGKMAPRKVGLAPIQREGMDYEFDITADMDVDHNLIIGKTRWSKLDGEVIKKPGVEFGRALAGWLADGPAPAAQADPEDQPTRAAQPAGLITPEMIWTLSDLIGRSGMSDYKLRAGLAKRGVAAIEHLTLEDAADMIRKLQNHLDQAEGIDGLVDRIKEAKVDGPTLPDDPEPADSVPSPAESPDDYTIPTHPRREPAKSRKSKAANPAPAAEVGNPEVLETQPTNL